MQLVLIDSYINPKFYCLQEGCVSCFVSFTATKIINHLLQLEPELCHSEMEK